MTTSLQGIQERIKKARLLKGFTQKKLALAIDKSTPVISDYECGRASPPLDVIAKIAEALQVNIEWMLVGKTITDVRKGVNEKTTLLHEAKTILEEKLKAVDTEQNELRTKKKYLNQQLKNVNQEIEILGG